MREKKVRVKLTGDGTNIGKRLHVVNFAFTLLDEGDKAYSAAGESNLCLVYHINFNKFVCVVFIIVGQLWPKLPSCNSTLLVKLVITNY